MGLSVNTDHLREVIRAKLLTKCAYVAYKKAKQATGTHIVFLLDTYTSEELASKGTLDVRISGLGDSSSEVEALTDAVWDDFDHWYYIDDQLQLRSYQNTRHNLDEGDDSVITRRLLIELDVL